jgi:hypothetical protein
MSDTETSPGETHEITAKPKEPAANTTGLKVAAAFLIASLGFVAGVVFSRSGGSPDSAALEDLRGRVDVLASETSGLRANSELLVSRLPALALLQRTTTFKFAERIYDRVDTSVGPLLLRLDNVEPYENGVKLTLALGNVHSAAFEGFELGLQWAEGNKRQAFLETLLPGRWTAVPVLLAPATEKTSSVTIEASLDKVALYR